MLKNMIIAVSVTTLALISFPIMALAVVGIDPDPSEDVMQITQTDIIEQEAPQSESREDRIKRLKDKATERMSVLQTRRVEARCSNAQQKLSNLSARLGDSLERRSSLYQNTTNKLNELVLKLQAAGVDTTELEQAINEMTDLINSSLASADNYVQNLADVTNVDCVSDPEAFKLLLDEARQKRVEIVSFQSKVQAIKNDKLKPVLQTIRDSLSTEATNVESGE